MEDKDPPENMKNYTMVQLLIFPNYRQGKPLIVEIKPFPSEQKSLQFFVQLPLGFTI